MVWFSKWRAPWLFVWVLDPAPVATEGIKYLLFCKRSYQPGNAFDVNSKSKLEILDGSTLVPYSLFDASSLIVLETLVGGTDWFAAGMVSFSHTWSPETAELTHNRQTFTSTLTAAWLWRLLDCTCWFASEVPLGTKLSILIMSPLTWIVPVYLFWDSWSIYNNGQILKMAVHLWTYRGGELICTRRYREAIYLLFCNVRDSREFIWREF